MVRTALVAGLLLLAALPAASALALDVGLGAKAGAGAEAPSVAVAAGAPEATVATRGLVSPIPLDLRLALDEALPGSGVTYVAVAEPAARAPPAEVQGTPDGLPASAPATVGASLAASAILAKFLGASLYSRIPRSRLLDHPTRKALLDLVKSQPGIPLQDAQASLAVGWGTAVHHVERLEKEGMLVSERGGARRLFAAGAMPPAERHRLVALAGDTTSRIARWLAHHPGAQQKELCEALSIAPSVASKHIAKLREAGVVQEERSWRSVRYWASAVPEDAVTETPAALPEPAGPALAG